MYSPHWLFRVRKNLRGNAERRTVVLPLSRRLAPCLNERLVPTALEDWNILPEIIINERNPLSFEQECDIIAVICFVVVQLLLCRYLFRSVVIISL